MSDLSLTYKIFNIQCLFRRILLSFASKLQISLNHFIQDDINTYYFVNGVLQKTYAVENNPGLLNYSLNERERGKSAAQLFSEALWKVCTHFTHWQNINFVHISCCFLLLFFLLQNAWHVFFLQVLQVICVQVRDDLRAIGCSAMLDKYDSYTVMVNIYLFLVFS